LQDPEKMAEAVMLLITNEELRQKLIKNAQKNQKNLK